jgi:hypothetical protein
MKAYKHLLQFAVDRNVSFSVDDGDGEWQKCGTDVSEAVDIIEGVEECHVRFEDGSVAFIVPSGLEDDETVVDYTQTEFTLAWENEWELTCD